MGLIWGVLAAMIGVAAFSFWVHYGIDAAFGLLVVVGSIYAFMGCVHVAGIVLGDIGMRRRIRWRK